MTDPIHIAATESPTALTFDAEGRPVIAAANVAPPSSPEPVEIAASDDTPPAWAGELAAAMAAGVGTAVANALASAPAAAPPAVTQAHVNAEALDYLRPDAPHSFVRDGFAMRESRDADAAARLVRFGRMVEAGALHSGSPYANALVGE
ncbi:MAG TPA: hypothetical protein VNN79_02295, partial [Actinomycetota bacterium]|nr:hypothetical protein [Actinomycetota bacterium]